MTTRLSDEDIARIDAAFAGNYEPWAVKALLAEVKRLRAVEAAARAVADAPVGSREIDALRSVLGDETPRAGGEMEVASDRVEASYQAQIDTERDLFRSLPPEELAQVQVPTREEIQEALERGREARRLAESAIRPGGRGRY